MAKAKHAKSSISPARRAAFDALIRVEGEGAYASPILAAISPQDLSSEDRALAQEITLGVLRRRKTLDYFIELYSSRTVETLDLPVLIALRVGLYQLRFLARVPVWAAVNESVSLVKRARLSSAAGLVNAVLRNAARSSHETEASEIEDPAERASVELSHPRWMIERWQEWLGDAESKALAAANNAQPRASFRANTLQAPEDAALDWLRSEGVTARPSRLVAGAWVMETGASSALIAAAERGAIYIQDEASQLVSLILEPNRGDCILDLCAAPGSKSSHIAALTGGDCWIVACDIHPHRLATLRAACRRLGASCVDLVVLDGACSLPFTSQAPKFDRVLIDAPCSGTGTLRRNPEIKWRLKPDDIARLATLQLLLLERAAEAVASGGRIVYSTCSLEPEENERVIERFLDSGARFTTVHPNAHCDLLTRDGYVRTFPHRHEMDGFFAAVLEKG